MRRTQPVTFYPPTELLNWVDQKALAKERPRTWMLTQLVKRARDREQRRRKREPQQH